MDIEFILIILKQILNIFIFIIIMFTQYSHAVKLIILMIYLDSKRKNILLI